MGNLAIDDIKIKVVDTYTFSGSAQSPLLAPRGVYLAAGKLFVADTAQNRLFIWNELPDVVNVDPDVVLGQRDIDSTGRNEKSSTNGSSLFYPSGIWSDGERLIVADAWNHRVLIWHSIPKKDGCPADVVVGQPDFLCSQPNVKGIGCSPTSRSLNWPYGVYSDGFHLWIADTGNRRVLFFESIPSENFIRADRVIGKPDFMSRDYDNNDAIWPYSVKVSESGVLAITDTQYFRVLIWRDWKKAFEKKADVVLGQKDFEASGQNQYGWSPKANTLNWCYDTCFLKEGIFVADTGNSRLLWFDQIPGTHNANAVHVLGQDDFNTGSENKNTIRTTEDSLYWPFQMCIEGNKMVVADTGNHRIVINKLDY